MIEKMTRSDAGESLHERAEERVRVAESSQETALSPAQARQVLHDLRVHQIELEMQNEELRRAQADLETSRQRYFDLYNLAPVGYFTFSERGMILEANLTFAKLLGVNIGSLIQHPLSRFILPEDQDIFYRFCKALFETGTPQVCEIRLVGKQGDSFWARLEATMVQKGDGPPGCRAVISDITEHKQAEETRKQAQQAQKNAEVAEASNRSKDQFIAVLSHELRTPLTPVLALADALQMHEGLPPSVRSDLELIRRNVEMEATLIDDLLDVTRISGGKIRLQLKIVDAHDCLQTALEICQKNIDAKHLDVRVEFHAALHHVSADPTRLRQVFWNLLSNAAKFTPDGGRITLSTRNVGDRLQIEITDTGAGIDPEAMPRIFSPFQQGEQSKIRQFGGLGLGLSIVKALVEMHHGTVTALSDGTNQGATFIVELDTVPPGQKAVATPAPSVEPKERHLRILLVEDHLDTLNTLIKLLKIWGHSVTTAENVSKAEKLAARQEFDLIISDLGLPDGSGLDVMRQVKEHSGTPGIVLSGYGTEEDIRQSREAGFAEHLVKPFNVGALRSAIRQCALAGS